MVPFSPYRVAIQGGISILDPHLPASMARDPIFRLLFARLVQTQGDFSLAPDLAESWQVESSGKRIRFALREAQFHDGNPVTATDVQFSLGRALRSGLYAMNQLAEFAAIREGSVPVDRAIEVHSDRELSVHLAEPTAELFLQALAWADASIVPRNFDASHPIGAGAYRFESRTENRLVLRRTALPAPHEATAPEVVEFVWRTPQEAEAEMAAGEVHEFDTFQFTEVKAAPLHSETHVVFFSVVRVLGIGRGSRVFADRNDRLEFAHLFPREKFVREREPDAAPAYSVIPAGLWGFETPPLPQVATDFEPREGEKTIVIGTLWADEVEAYTELFQLPAFIARGWRVRLQKYEDTSELLLDLRSGRLDAAFTTFAAKSYDTLSILDVFSHDGYGCFASSGDQPLEALLSQARASKANERLGISQKIDARLVGEGFVIPVVQDSKQKFVSVLREPWVTGSHIQLWDRVGIVAAGDGNRANELNRAFAATKRASALVGDLESAVRDLVTERELSRFAAQVAHDIRSPLTALKMLEGALPSLGQQERRLMQMAVGRIEEIANTLLTRVHRPNRLTAHKPVVLCSLVALVEAVVEEKRLEFRDRPAVVLRLHVAEGVAASTVRINSSEAKRVLSNLLNNAFEAIESEGRVNVRLGADAHHWRVVVEDTGRGIPPDIMRQLEATAATFGKKQGAGLGLSYARERMKAWSGTVSLVSEVGRGTAVTLAFPR